MSYLDQLRASVKPEAEEVVNNQEIKEQETTLDVNDGEKDTPPADVENKDINVKNDNEDTDDAEKLEGVGKLIELRNVVENDKSLEGSNELVQYYVNVLKTQYKIDLESDGSETNEGLLAKIKNKVATTMKSIKNWSNETLDKIRGIDEIPAIINHLKSLDKDGKARFEAKLAEATSKYLNGGKLVQPSETVKRIREFDAKLANGFAKAARAVIGLKTGEINNATTATEFLNKQLKVVAGIKLDLAALKIEITANEKYGNVDAATVVGKQETSFSVKIEDVIKYLSEVEKDWAEFRKLVTQNQATWNKIVNELNGGMASTDEGLLECSYSLYFSIAHVAKAIYASFDYPRKDIVNILSRIRTAAALK